VADATISPSHIKSRNEKKIAPHITVIDKSERDVGSLSRQDFKLENEAQWQTSACLSRKS